MSRNEVLCLSGLLIGLMITGGSLMFPEDAHMVSPLWNGSVFDCIFTIVCGATLRELHCSMRDVLKGSAIFGAAMISPFLVWAYMPVTIEAVMISLGK